MCRNLDGKYLALSIETCQNSTITAQFVPTRPTRITLRLDDIRASKSGVTFTVTSDYDTEYDLEVDFSVTYDHGYYDPQYERWVTDTNINDSDFYHVLRKNNCVWEVFLPFSTYLGDGSESFDNIRYEFTGNNGISGNGVNFDGITYYVEWSSGNLGGV